MAIIKNISAANRTVTDLHGVTHTIAPGASLSMNGDALPPSAYASLLASAYIEVSDENVIKDSGTILTPDFSEKAVATVAKTLPATTSKNIFSVVGGPVQILDLFGEVTTIIQNQTCNFKYSLTDTASSTTTDLSANVDIAASRVGSFLTLGTTLGATTVISSGGTSAADNVSVRAPVGNIKVTTGATNTGDVTYHVRYRPLVAGAKIIAA